MANPNWAAWRNETAKGDEYLTVKGRCPGCGCEVKKNLFANTFKQPGEKSPDFKEPTPKPINGGNPPPVKADADPNDQDMPF